MLVFLRNYHPQTDAQHYIDIATSVAHGHGFAADYPYVWVHATAFRPPAVPAAAGRRVRRPRGPSRRRPGAERRHRQRWSSSSSAVLATRVGGQRAGLIAAGLAAVYPPLLANDGVPLSEPLGLLVMLAAIWALLAGRPGWAGIAAGLLVLTRPERAAAASR